MQPTVSVIMGTFNRAKLVPSAVRCLLRQTHRPLELVVIDDGSRDETGQVLAALRPEVEAAGAIASFESLEANQGLACARNRGLERARGEYLAFFDDDDSWEPEFLEAQLARIAQTGADACCCLLVKENTTRADETVPAGPERLLEGLVPAEFLDFRRGAHITGLLVSTRLAREAGPFVPELRTGQDTEWLVRLCHLARWCNVPRVLGRYNQNESALSRVKSHDQQLARDERQKLALRLMRENNRERPNFDENAWKRRVARKFDEFVKHRLYARDIAGARAVLDEGAALCGEDLLAATRRKIRKARWLSWLGLSLRNPKA